ncbi:sensor histidine kinase [Aridibaculum aurantiacum]|uniref:sensor histidine kinase n=1 Tax=Aridibaculum aurantiacum TaxID=2810307 RepID=UPI001A95E351|nr:HAMP domain-containing sensor histidine kinase [Aridibaculum aurantiacum]
MRLLTKTTLCFLLLIMPLLAIAGYYLYFQFSKELNTRLDEELVTEEVQWIRYLRSQSGFGTSFILKTPDIVIFPVQATPTRFPSIATKEEYDEADKTKVSYRQLEHIVSIGGIPYQIIIRKSQKHRSALVAEVTRIMLLVFIFLFVVTMLFNWIINKELWRPFRRSLQKIKGAELQKMEALHFEESTSVKEFNELNASLNMMAEKIHSDYISIKEFTENAAHEMQTPLAVVQSKLELLLQDSDLQENQLNTLVQASTAITRLSKINQSLLLLAKIENHQFDTTELVSMTAVTRKYLALFHELMMEKQLQVNFDERQDWKLPLHASLADTLVSNLLGNAIKYNHTGGRIEVVVDANCFTISNSSHLPAIDKNQLFKRFLRQHAPTDLSTGLGLAIVKKIADVHQLQINYSAENGLHRFEVKK